MQQEAVARTHAAELNEVHAAAAERSRIQDDAAQEATRAAVRDLSAELFELRGRHEELRAAVAGENSNTAAIRVKFDVASDQIRQLMKDDQDNQREIDERDRTIDALVEALKKQRSL